MAKKERLVISIGAMIGGLLLCGYSLTSSMESQLSTLCTVAGLVVGVGGFISLILAVKRPG
ncbi:MAG TPA: hypothetical protein VG737_17225 [Cyclobacteriaceae bacterium]|nr:hypothetical protein [Cyclobacteriaceae bacterium]